MKLLVIALSFLLSAAGLVAGNDVRSTQSSEWVSGTFHFESKTIQGASYSIQVQPNGIGAYWQGQPDFNLAEAVGAEKITFGKDTLHRVAASQAVVSDGNCETHAKNIAQTGRKTIVFTYNDNSSQCEFNYSDDERLNDAAIAFQAVAETMQVGERLKHDQRFDRLGLDAEMDALMEEVKNGQAIEVQNIAQVLQALVDDDRVMERVKHKAARLIEGAGIPVKQ